MWEGVYEYLIFSFWTEQGDTDSEVFITIFPFRQVKYKLIEKTLVPKRKRVNFCIENCMFTIYTERQKKLITSSGRHSLKPTISILIIFGYKLEYSVKEEYLKNTRFSRVKKENYAVKSRKVIFRKSQKQLTERAPRRQPIHNIQ